MAAFEVIALDTATPQLRAPGASDTYTFPRAVEMPLGTANGVLYLNGSKVATSGSALTFDGSTFAVNSAASIGSNTAKTKFYSDITYNGIFNGASLTAAESVYMGDGGLYFVTAGSERMRLTSTGLGIGTSSPAANLQVGASTSGSQVVALAYSATSAGSIDFRANGSAFGAAWIQHDAASGAMRFATAGNERMRLDSSGNLGLGVTPSSWFSDRRAMQLGSGASVNGSATTSSFVEVGANFYQNASSADTYVASSTASKYRQLSGAHSWHTAPSGTAGNAISFTQAMTLDASGNLGIGSTSPSGITAGYTTVDIRGASGGGIRTGKASAESGLWYTDATQGWFGTVSNIPQVFYTNNTERSRIPSAGGMVVGTAALATTATDGFLYVPTCAGTPTGTPTTQTGTAPIVINTTNNKLYFYSGGAWRDAGP